MRRALGRGLGALLPDASGTIAVAPVPAPAPATNGFPDQLIQTNQIRPNPSQPRQAIAEGELAGLVDSIRQYGVIQPLLVRTVDGGFELIAGERRWRAAQKAGLERVPAIVRETTAAESFELALIENLQRQDLSPLEEAEAYARLMDEFGLTQEQVAERIGKSRATIANLVRLLGLPQEVKEQIAAGALTMGHARALLAAPTAARQIALARDVVQRGMSVREIERLASRPAISRRQSRTAGPDVHVQAVEEELCRLLGTRVRLVSKARGGCIEITYHSADELERLLGCMRGLDLRSPGVL